MEFENEADRGRLALIIAFNPGPDLLQSEHPRGIPSRNPG